MCIRDRAYATAHLGTTDVFGEKLDAFGADALTVNGYLGTDGIQPLLGICGEKMCIRDSGEGVMKKVNTGKPVGLYIRKKMGKALALVALVAVFTVSAAACGSGGQEAEPSPTASPTPAPTPAVEMVKVATVTDIEGSLNIRSAASTDSEILSEAYAGDRFEVLTENYSEGWHEISYNGGKAYVSADFVTVSEMDASVPVSYTHLDVYKRQGLRRCKQGRCRCAGAAGGRAAAR